MRKQYKIMIAGFYGAGNSGDEAMLRNFVYKIRKRIPNSIFFIATDKNGLWDYDGVYYISPMDRSRLHLCDLLIIGGGDLGVGFGWHLLVFGKSATKVKAINMGVSINNTWTEGAVTKCVYEMLHLYNKIYVRDAGSKKNLDSLGIDCEATTDIAIDLPEEPCGILRKGEQVCLVIREVAEKHREQQVALAEKVIDHISKDYFLTVLPFSPEDAAFCKQFKNLKAGKSQTIFTFNPQHHKYVISNSKYLVSLGRFHPLVYAMEKAVPMIGMTYPEVYQYSKIDAWMKHIQMEDCCMNFIAPFDYFVKKWERLQNNSDYYRSRIKRTYRKMKKINEAQFDEVAKLILGE